MNSPHTEAMDAIASKTDLRAESALVADIGQLIVNGESIGKVLRTILDESVRMRGGARLSGDR